MESATSDPAHVLQVFIANEARERLRAITDIVEALGHEVVGRDTDIANIGELSRSTGAEVALVGLGLRNKHALDQIAAIVHEAACPVIAILDAEDPTYIDQAAEQGVFAYVVLDGDDTTELRGALAITLRRFAQFQNLKGAFGRRAIIEQAKGILMAHNNVDADTAFELLKAHSQKSGQKLNDVAEALTQNHHLLPYRHTDSDPTRPA